MRIQKEENGQILVMVALCLTVIFGFLAFAIDVGLLFNNKRKLQNAVDAVGLPATIQASFAGTAAAFQSSTANMGMLLLIALIVVYIILGVLYESFIHPLTILSGLPSAAVLVSSRILSISSWARATGFVSPRKPVTPGMPRTRQ